MLKFTLIAPIYNEGRKVKTFLDTLFSQTRKADEIILVDGGSTDNTFQILKSEEEKYSNLKVYQLTGKNIRVGNIAKNRNLAIRKAIHEIILCVDAGGEIDKNYCKYMMESFEKNDCDVVGGNYRLSYKTEFQQKTNAALEAGKDFGASDFNPSSRSIGFKKYVWEAVGGYPEYLTLAGEDTYFNYLIKKNGYKFIHQGKAIVYWDGREDLSGLLKQVYFYNKGDAEVLIIKKVIMNRGFYIFVFINIYLFLTFISLFISYYFFLFLLMFLLFVMGAYNYQKVTGNIFFKLKLNLFKIIYLYLGYMSGISYGINYLLKSKGKK